MTLEQRITAAVQAIGTAIKKRLQACSVFVAYTDCIANTADNFFAYTVSGTGAAFSTLSPGTDNAIGIMRAALGTVATNRCAISCTNLAVLLLGKGTATFRSKVRIVTLSNATNTYSFRAGFIDSISAEAVDGCFFRYTHSVNSGKFQAVCRSNSVETSSAIDTGVTVVANTWYDLYVEVNAAGTSATFYINATLVATVALNIPTANGRDTGYGVMALRSVGTAAVNCYDCDYVDVWYQFTSNR
jgi:hypothetical protein